MVPGAIQCRKSLVPANFVVVPQSRRKVSLVPAVEALSTVALKEDTVVDSWVAGDAGLLELLKLVQKHGSRHRFCWLDSRVQVPFDIICRTRYSICQYVLFVAI